MLLLASENQHTSDLIVFSRCQSLVSESCGQSQRLMTLLCSGQLALSHLISNESPLPSPKQMIIQENVKDFWLCVPSISNSQCFHLIAVWFAFCQAVLSPCICCFSWESFKDILVLKSLLEWHGSLISLTKRPDNCLQKCKQERRVLAVSQYVNLMVPT